MALLKNTSQSISWRNVHFCIRSYSSLHTVRCRCLSLCRRGGGGGARLSLLLNIVLQPLPACSENSSIFLLFFLLLSFRFGSSQSRYCLSSMSMQSGHVWVTYDRVSHYTTLIKFSRDVMGGILFFFKINDAEGKTCLVSINISSVVEFQRWWVLESKLFAQKSTCSKEILIPTTLNHLWFSVDSKNQSF